MYGSRNLITRGHTNPHVLTTVRAFVIRLDGRDAELKDKLSLLYKRGPTLLAPY